MDQIKLKYNSTITKDGLIHGIAMWYKTKLRLGQFEEEVSSEPNNKYYFLQNRMLLINPIDVKNGIRW